MMKILVLCHEYPPVGGGGGRVAQDLCQGFVHQGHEVKLVTAHYGDLSFNEHDNGVEIIRVRSRRKLAYKAGLGAMAGYVWSAFWKGLQVAREWKPDVIHVHFAVPAGAAAWLLSKVSGIPYVLTAHLGDVPGGTPEKTGGWFKWVMPFTHPIWRSANKVIAVSEYTKGLAAKRYPVSVQVIPNGVDTTLLNPEPIQLNQPPQIVFAGRFVPQKNPLQIIDSLSAVKDLHWNAVLIGDGQMRPEIEAAIAQHGLQERVRITGWVKPEEVIELYRQSDILFMPSRSEGLPVTGVQAMSMGLALLLSRAGGNPELIEQGVNGFLVEQDQPARYAEILRLLIEDPSLLLKTRLASRAAALKFDLDGIINAYLDVFRSVIKS